MTTPTDLVAYRIDDNDRIVFVDAGFAAFAHLNGAEELVPPQLTGDSLWRWISDPATVQMYTALLARVRAGIGPVRFSFRCDTPVSRRLLEMNIRAGAAGEVVFETRLLRSRSRAPLRLLDAAVTRSDALLTICGWCLRIPDASGAWMELEDAVAALHLFESAELPQLSHGMCPACYESMRAALDDADLAASGEIRLGELP